MSTAEFIIAILGAAVVAGGFLYGIHDTYFQKKNSDVSPDKDNPAHKRPD